MPPPLQMEVIPLGDVIPSEDAGEASSEVELDDEEATPPSDEDDTGDAETSDEPLVPVGAGDETGEDVGSLPPPVEDAEPSDSPSDQAEPSSSSGTDLPAEPVSPGAETTPGEGDETFWSNLPGAEEVPPGVVQPSEPPPPAPQGGGKVSADDIVI